MALPCYHKVLLPVRLNLQDTVYDCGPASLKIILETLGLPLSEERLMRMGKTTPEKGTSPENLMRTLDDLGVKYEVFERANLEIMEEKINDLNLCLIDYQGWGEGGSDFEDLRTGHYSVVFGYSRHHLYVADPAKHHLKKQEKWGARRIRKDIFYKHWADKEEPGAEEVVRWMVTVPLTQAEKFNHKKSH